eukprot:3940311-Rhodomonas_salina.6
MLCDDRYSDSVCRNARYCDSLLVLRYPYALISLRTRYGMSGTGIAYALAMRCPEGAEEEEDVELTLWEVRRAICLLDCYAMSGTDIARGDISLRARYAMSGTDIAY